MSPTSKKSSWHAVAAAVVTVAIFVFLNLRLRADFAWSRGFPFTWQTADCFCMSPAVFHTWALVADTVIGGAVAAGVVLAVGKTTEDHLRDNPTL